MAGTLWIDVEDLFEYAVHNPRPSGIQRLAFEICRSLQQQYGHTGRIRFVRHDPVRLSLQTVPWASVERLFDRLTDADRPGPAPPRTAPASGIAPEPALRRWARRLVYRLPPGLRRPLIRFVMLQWQSLGAFGAVLAALWQGPAVRVRRLFRARPDAAPATAPVVPELRGKAPAPGVFAKLASPGDVLAVLGSPWFHPDYGGLIAALQARHGMRFALLVYDIIPLRHPEWCDRGLVRIFRAWFAAVLPLTDTIFAISRATAEDLECYMRETGIPSRGKVLPIPIGTGFGAAAATPHVTAASGRLPRPGSYALIVSTIEARKNHVLLFRIWRRLLRDMPREQVPTLVFAGRVGWLVSDLMQQLANTDWLDGKIQVVENPTDAELETLYRGCLFTLFPSLYEGWGLPVTESLAFGKPCVIANRTSLPEAGGALARYFDPENINDAYRVVRATIEDREGLAAWAATVRREFRPISWSETAAAILHGIGLDLGTDAPSGTEHSTGEHRTP